MGRLISTSRLAAVVAIAALAAGCTLKKQEAPGLTGPSELGTSLAIAASPDVLAQDGASQSQVTITVRGANGQPQSGVGLRAEIVVGGVRTDFGTLSARSLVTDGSGRAAVTYTAPPTTSSITTGTVVDIAVTPTSGDYSNDTPRSVSIRLVPPGVIVPPETGVTPNFTVNPGAPQDNQPVLFDGSGSTTTSGVITSYQWNFGDGGTATGMTASHTYALAGTYVVTLRVTNSIGATNTKSQSVTVGQGANPTATFVMSPASPVIGQTINFNASASTPAAGRRIAGYSWDFGDGTSGGGQTTAHAYATAGTYTIVLVVTDDAGHYATATQSVTVSNGNPTAQIVVTPPTATTGTPVSFIGSGSTPAPGRTIVSYSWDFGDGSKGSGATTSHPYGSAGTYTVTLIVTDDQGKQGVATATVTIS
jgi:PKD repeat protein